MRDPGQELSRCDVMLVECGGVIDGDSLMMTCVDADR
jgi:hypothetical protein